MIRLLVILSITLVISQNAISQDLFFIGEISLPRTSTISLQSNSEDQAKLDIIFAKDDSIGFVGISTKTLYPNESFVDKLIIYLQNGAVVTCSDMVVSENVDSNAKALFYLSNEDLSKMKESDIHTVRYTLNFILSETLYSATNKGINTSDIATTFFDGNNWATIDIGGDNYKFNHEEAERIQRYEEQRRINEVNSHKQGSFANAGNGSGGAGTGASNSQGVTFPGGNQGVTTGDPNANSYGQGGSGSGNQGSGVSFSLSGRSAVSLPKPKYPGNDAGIVVVRITVDSNGNVTSAEAGVRGTTIANQSFLNEAKQAALKAKFNVDSSAPSIQQGTITFRFVLD